MLILPRAGSRNNLPQLAILGGGVWGAAFAKALLSKPAPDRARLESESGELTDSDKLQNSASGRLQNSDSSTSDKLQICFWDRDSDCAKKCAQEIGGIYRDNIADVLPKSDVLIVAVSSAGFCTVLQEIADAGLPKLPPILWLTKGFVKGGDSADKKNSANKESAIDKKDSTDKKSAINKKLGEDDLLLCEAAAAILPSSCCFGVLSGPTFADEISAGLPAAMVLAVNQSAPLHNLQQILHRKMLRLYASDDLLGVCAGGALKNVIAIAAGICDGLQLGANARAAVITRGLAEMSDFNRAVGGRADTMYGIAGVGDLLLTCTSDLSRNRRLGLAIGKGEILPHQLGISETSPTSKNATTSKTLTKSKNAPTTEGVAAAASAHRRAAHLGLTLPIITAVHGVLQGALPPKDAVELLLSRPLPTMA